MLTPDEMRRQTARRIAALKWDVERYQQLAKSGGVTSLFLTQMRLDAAVKIARLKIEADKYPEPGKLTANMVKMTAAKKVSPVSPLTQSIDKNKRPKEIKRDVKEQVRTKSKDSDWVDRQAKKLLGDFVLETRFTAT
jgi:hypothetical protein